MSKGKGKNNPSTPKTNSHNPQQKPTGQQQGQFQGQYQVQPESSPTSSYGSSTGGSTPRQHPGTQRTNSFNPSNPAQKPVGENRPHHGNPNKQGQPSNQQFKK
jgi:hypothetical protein